MRIKPRAGRIAQSNRGEVSIGRQQVSQPMQFPAPTGGLVTTADLASQAAGNACVLTNWFPTLKGARIRGGYKAHGLTADGKDIVSAFRYKYGTTERMFVATATAIFDMTAPAAPPATTAAAVSGLTGGDWCTFQHTNAGVSYLVALNGSDTRRLFDGASWTTTPAITFSDSTTMAQLNYGWLFANREWFIKNSSLDAYYIGVAAFGGAATVFPLGGVMRKGGSLLTGFSWSLETGDGTNEYCVFVSTEGEVAIYAGTDPSSSSTWALQGVYQIGKPLGKNAWVRAGGDVLIATTDGLTPMSQVFQRDRESLSLVSASRPIEDDWRTAAISTSTGWTLKLWPEENLLFVSFPRNVAVTDTTFVMNSLTGKWAIIKNWQGLAYECLQGGVFFGSTGGKVWRGDITGSDNGMSFSASYLAQFRPTQFGERANASMASMYFLGSVKPNVLLFARADENRSVPNMNTVSSVNAAGSTWDAGLWDSAIWDGVSQKNRYRFRQNVRASGDLMAVGCVITSSGDTKLDIEVDLGLLQVSPGEMSA
ncbi:hypothetical protein ACQZ4Z_13030 [Agrobacterium vitis]|uniref:hypothetical protein n=1 Tax=Agrobacterium vitis TaxID=373 RepID=UPI0015726F76|nr:hypothetical protein [Agrobacterium vitis]NSZ42838.1 hypothetical protein [Agrobacterium vitis]